VKHPWFTASSLPRVLAHRGLVTPAAAESGVAENSFAAVAAAHAAGAHYVESDCHVTSDGVVVLVHDADLSSVTGDPRSVADVTEGELEDLMADRGGLITLAQALDAFPTIRFNLDVKVETAAESVGRLVAPHADRVLVTSFSDERRRVALAAATTAGARPATSAGTATMARVLTALALRSDRMLGRALEGVDALQVPERRGPIRVVTRRMLEAVHSHGVEVHVWTVNDVADMQRLLTLGVDGLVTDCADVALTLVATDGPAAAPH
jgi:glycerophosphoryl diester phosphodiesterase